MGDSLSQFWNFYREVLLEKQNFLGKF
jgi:hypothetical protein